MNRKAAKELPHIQSWLIRVDQIATRGKEEYVADALLQEAGDSLMMKLGEAANRLLRLGALTRKPSSERRKAIPGGRPRSGTGTAMGLAQPL